MENKLTKVAIKEAIKEGQNSLDNLIKDNIDNNGALVLILQNIGKVHSNVDVKSLVPLLNSKNERVKTLAIKNIAKFCSLDNLELLKKLALFDSSTSVRQCAAAAIGRMRNKAAIPVLKEVLKDKDAKVTCQAIRGLLVFKGEKEVDDALLLLKDSENEVINAVIKKEYGEKQVTKSHNALQFPSFMGNAVVNADVLDVLKAVDDESVHLTFTSPPYYNARDYSIYSSYEAYLNFLQNVFLQVHRITKEGRFLIVNTSPIIVARIGRKYQSHRYPIPFDLHAKIIQSGWEFLDDIIWEKPEYSVKNRIGGFMQHRKPLAYKPNTVTEYLMVYRKKTDKLLDWNIRQYPKEVIEKSKVLGDFETTNVWHICPKSSKVHSAIFPEGLCKRVIEYYSYVGDLVFDPFAGSGTVGRVASALGRKFFLVEKEREYFDYIKSTLNEGTLFNESAVKFLSLEEFKSEAKLYNEKKMKEGE